jgi:Trk K+ transport system NAD-binding subunit
VIFGINEIGLKLAEIIRTSGQEVICIDQNPIACRIAQTFISAMNRIVIVMV